MSIASASFCFSRPAHVIAGVQTIAETRRQRLSILLTEHKSLAELNERLGLARTDATLSQIKNQSAHHKTGKPRAMGDDLARRIELTLGLEEGWMDTPPGLAEQFGHSEPLDKMAALMAAMEPEMQYKVVRMVAALSQPAEGTNGEKH